MTRTRARWARRRLLRPVTLIGLALATLPALALPVHAADQPPGAHRPAPAQDGRIYFVDGSSGQITSTTATGSGRKSLKGLGNSPAVSPDGTRIAYEIPTGRGIAVENADGTGRQVLVPESGGMPSWSPDGSRIVYSTENDIAVVTVATKAVTHLTDDGGTTEEVAPAWSPNGQWIAFTVRGCDNGNGRCVFRIDAATGGNRVNLTPFRHENVTSDEADWSPTNTLDYSSGGCNGGGINIWSMSAAGKAKSDLTCDADAYNSDTSPTDAPSGDRVAFVSDERVDKDYAQLYVMSADGTGITYVDTGSRFGLKDPDWAVAPTPQGTTLTLSATPSTVASGHPVKLSGALIPASGQAYAGQKVVIMTEPDGSTTYSPVATVRTVADGTWKTSLQPTSTTSYQATYAADATLGLGSSTSPAHTVTVG